MELYFTEAKLAEEMSQELYDWYGEHNLTHLHHDVSPSAVGGDYVHVVTVYGMVDLDDYKEIVEIQVDVLGFMPE